MFKGIVPIQIDIETADIRTTGKILSLGAVNMNTGAKSYWKFDPHVGMNADRTVAKGTMYWWENKVDPETRDEAWGGEETMEVVLPKIKQWFKKQGVFRDIHVFANPSTFDCLFIEDAIQQLNLIGGDIGKMWMSTNVHNYKTFTRLAWGVHKVDDVSEIMRELGYHNKHAHSAIADAVYQTEVLYEACKKLGTDLPVAPIQLRSTTLQGNSMRSPE